MSETTGGGDDTVSEGPEATPVDSGARTDTPPVWDPPARSPRRPSPAGLESSPASSSPVPGPDETPADEPAHESPPPDGSPAGGLPTYPTGGYPPPSYATGSYPPPAYPPGGYPPGPAGAYDAYGSVGPAAAGPALAGYWRRVLGWIIDFIVVGVVGTLLSVPFRHVSAGRINFHVSDTNTHVVHYYTYSLLGAAVMVVVALLYGGILCGSRRGQTVGMMAAGVRAVDLNTGGPLGFWRALGRAAFEYLLLWLFFIPWVLDMLFPAWDRRRQTLHDKVSRCVVILAPPQGAPTETGGYPSS